MKCENCSAELLRKWNYCPHCGRKRRKRSFVPAIAVMFGFLFLTLFALYPVFGRSAEDGTEGTDAVPASADRIEGKTEDGSEEVSAMLEPIESAIEFIKTGRAENALRALPPGCIMSLLPEELSEPLGGSLGTFLLCEALKSARERLGNIDDIGCEIAALSPVEDAELDELKSGFEQAKDLPQRAEKAVICVHYKKNGIDTETVLTIRIIELGGKWYLYPNDVISLLNGSNEQ